MDYSYQGRHPPSQLAAMAISYNLPLEQSWFADSGATNHITNNMKMLSVHSDYQGTETVAVGNGQGLPILKTGSSIGHTPTSSFKLTNILRVPEISTNLLFVHQFTKDVFDSSGFTIQDRSGKILFLRIQKQ